MFELKYYRGRVALSKLLLAADVNENDNVVIQAFTCVAVPEAIYSIGAKPLYVDIEDNGVNMSPDKLEDMLMKNVNIKAIVVQHTFGIPAQMEKIYSLSIKYNIPLIEDCAHTLESTIENEKVGSWGVASFYSFEWGKPIVAGMGGAIKVNDKPLLKKLELQYKNLSSPGLIVNIKNTIQILAFFILYRPSLYWLLKDLFHYFSAKGLITGNFNCLIDKNNIVNNKEYSMKMPVINRLRLKYALFRTSKDMMHNKDIGALYEKSLKKYNIKNIFKVSIDPRADVYYARFPILVKNKAKLLMNARKDRVEISGWYNSPVHPLEESELHYVGYVKNSCPNAEKICEQLVSLPVNNKVSEDDVIKNILYIDSCMAKI
jgi:perosamine synthetase